MISKLKTILIVLFFARALSGTETIFKGQASAFISHASSLNKNTFPGNLRYLPEFNFSYFSGSNRYGFDLGAQASVLSKGLSEPEAKIEPYRAVFRLDRTRDQFRFGLQKINFGPGQVLRLLQWFDEQDVKDPLALSPGVWAGMYRRFFEGGCDLRIWTIYDQNSPARKLVSSMVPEQEGAPVDLGGRLEIPAGPGTAGITLHTLDPLEVSQTFTEIRGALDGRWDLQIGIWFESVLTRTNIPMLDIITSSTVMAGVDYTFGVGNGLYVSMEAARWNSDSNGKNENLANALSVTMNYPIGLNDAFSVYLTAIEQKGISTDFASFAGWRHTFGNWMTFVTVFDSPAVNDLNNNLPGGTGIQVYLAFNH